MRRDNIMKKTKGILRKLLEKGVNRGTRGEFNIFYYISSIVKITVVSLVLITK